MRHHRILAFAAIAALSVPAFGAAKAKKPEPTETVVLGTKSFWRWRTVWETTEVQRPSGEIGYFSYKYDRNWFRKNKDKVVVDEGQFKVSKGAGVRLPETTSEEWMKPAFDDSAWVRLRGPMLSRVSSKSPSVNQWKLILARGRFEVADPVKVKELTFSLTYRGGAVVYLNGQEVTRGHMPKGEIKTTTPSEPYPLDIYLDDKGYLVWPHDDKKVYEDRYRKRIRSIKEFKIPGSMLKKGVNVLAVSIHRSPVPERVFIGRIKRYPHGDERMHWCKCSLLRVKLAAPIEAGLAPSSTRPSGRGFLVWNHSIVRKVFVQDIPDPFSPLQPITLSGVRNGIFAGQVVVGDEKPIKGLNAVASDLSGPGTIPASAITVRWGVPDGAARKRGQQGPFDRLEDDPPAEVPVYKEHGGAVQSVWVNVNVPTDAKPGDYAGKVTISAEGVEPVAVPLKLKVADWALPDPNEFTATLDIAQSPGSVALAYGVEMWSDAHLKLLDKTFSLLRPLGNKTLYITCIRRTHWGNEHAMVRWFKGEKGDMQPNFDIVEKYLSVSIKHLGKIPGVVLYVWEPVSSEGHAGGTGTAVRTTDKDALITYWDPKKNKLKRRKGPAWGTAEAKTFWKRFNDGIVPVMKKHGLENSFLYGLIGDARPTKQSMEDITTGATKPRWAVHSHHYCVNWQGFPVGMGVALWGIRTTPTDPTHGHGFGWQNPFWLSYYPREMSMQTSLVETRTKLENWLGARPVSLKAYAQAKGCRGLGRLGADFWRVLKQGNYSLSLAGRYPESYWGQLNLNYGVPYLLGKGKKGPVPTVRYEAFRENVQETETRIYIEKALLDEAKKAKLGEDLASRCRKALDKRIRMCLYAAGEGQPWFISSGWAKRTEELFALAAEVSKKLGE